MLQIALKRDVDARGQFRFEVRVAVAVGLRPTVFTQRWHVARHQLVQRRRFVTARQAHANLIAFLRIGLEHRVHERREDATVVVFEHPIDRALGQDVFIAQPAIRRPLWVDLELVLRVERPALGAGLQISTVFGQGRIALLGALHLLQLHATDDLVAVVEHTGPLAGQAAAVVHKVLGFKTVAQHGLAAPWRRHPTGPSLVHAVVVVGLPQTKAHFQTVVGRQGLRPLAIQARHAVAAAAAGLGAV